MKLSEFMNRVRKDAASFEEFYRLGMEGPDEYFADMDEADWYEQYEAWLSLQEVE